MENLAKLLSISSGALVRDEFSLNKDIIIVEDDLIQMLQKRNGFYAFESALHVFPTCSKQQEIGLNDWNEKMLWRYAYQGLDDNCLFFAEDLFGMQFCYLNKKIYSFDPETGSLNYLALNIEDWAGMILGDYDFMTGYSLGHLWQKNNKPIPAGYRLLPKIPFVTGGGFSIENLYLSDAIQGMKFRASIANQIKSLPDGATIKFNIN